MLFHNLQRNKLAEEISSKLQKIPFLVKNRDLIDPGFSNQPNQIYSCFYEIVNNQSQLFHLT